MTARRESAARPGPGWWLARLVAAAALGVGLGVALDVVRAGGIEPWFASHRIAPPYLAGGLTITAAGTSAYVDCRGSGAPTVILESGLGTGAGGWGFVLDDVAAFTRVCAWDRPGIGRSAPIGRHTGAATAGLLRAVLDAAGERPPYVVVGHSLGGVYARIFAARQRSEVVGVVLVDPYLPDVNPLVDVDVDPALAASFERDLATTGETIAAAEDLDWDATLRELAGSSVDGIPLELLFVDQRLRWDARYDRWEERIIGAWRAQLARLSADERLTIAEKSTHLIQVDRPDLVVDSIRRLVDRARAAS